MAKFRLLGEDEKPTSKPVSTPTGVNRQLETLNVNTPKGSNQLLNVYGNLPQDLLNDQIANAQSKWDKRANALAQTLTTIVGDTVSGFGYLGEVFNASDSLMDDSHNLLVQLGNSISEGGRDLMPVYATRAAQEGFRPFDGDWWALNAPSIGSAVSLLIPARAVSGGIGLAGKAAKMGSTALQSKNKVTQARALITKSKQLGIDPKTLAGKNPLFQAMPSVGEAFVSRHMENMMEATGTFDSTYQEALAQGMSEEEAKRAAGEAAKANYKNGYLALMTDIPQYMALAGFKFPKIKASKSAIINKGRDVVNQMISEGFEENLQFAISEHSKKQALDPDYESSIAKEMYDSALDPEALTSTVFGALGGGVFGLIGSTKDALEDNRPDRAAAKNLAKKALTDDSVAGTMKDMENADEIPEGNKKTIKKTNEVIDEVKQVAEDTGISIEEQLRMTDQLMLNFFIENDQREIDKFKAQTNDPDAFERALYMAKVRYLESLDQTPEVKALLKKYDGYEKSRQELLEGGSTSATYASPASTIALRQLQNELELQKTLTDEKQTTKRKTTSTQESGTDQGQQKTTKESQKETNENFEKIEFPRFVEFGEYKDKVAKGQDHAKAEARENEKIHQRFKDTLQEGDKLIDKNNGKVFYFRNGVVVKPNGQQLGFNNIPNFISGVTIIRKKPTISKDEGLSKQGQQKAPTQEKETTEGSQVDNQSKDQPFDNVELENQVGQDQVEAQKAQDSFLKEKIELLKGKSVDILNKTKDAVTKELAKRQAGKTPDYLPDMTNDTLTKLVKEIDSRIEKQQAKEGTSYTAALEQIRNKRRNLENELGVDNLTTEQYGELLDKNPKFLEMYKNKKGFNTVEEAKADILRQYDETVKPSTAQDETVSRRTLDSEHVTTMAQIPEGFLFTLDTPGNGYNWTVVDIQDGKVKLTREFEGKKQTRSNISASNVVFQDGVIDEELTKEGTPPSSETLEQEPINNKEPKETADDLQTVTETEAKSAGEHIQTPEGVFYRWDEDGFFVGNASPELTDEIQKDFAQNKGKYRFKQSDTIGIWRQLQLESGETVMSDLGADIDFAAVRLISPVAGKTQIEFRIYPDDSWNSGKDGNEVTMENFRIYTIIDGVQHAGVVPEYKKDQHFRNGEKLLALRKKLWKEFQGKTSQYNSNWAVPLKYWHKPKFRRTAPRTFDGTGRLFGAKTENTAVDGNDNTVPFQNITKGAIYKEVEYKGRTFLSRLFTKQLEKDGDVVPVNTIKTLFPVLTEGLQGKSLEGMTYYDIVFNIYNLAKENPQFFKDNAASLLKELRSIVVYVEKTKDGNKVRPNFGPNLAEVQGFDPVKFTDNLVGRPLQVRIKSLNVGNYNEMIAHRLTDDLHSDVFHSPRFAMDLDSVYEINPTQQEEVEVPVPTVENTQQEATQQDLDDVDDLLSDLGLSEERETNDDLFRLAGKTKDSTGEKELAEFKKIFPWFNAKIVETIMTAGGLEAWGKFTNAAVEFTKNNGKGTGRHEAGHVLYEIALTESQRNAIRKEFRNKYGNELTELQIKELFSDSFMTYTDTGSRKGLRAAIRRIFEYLKRLINVALKRPMKSKELFKAMDQGMYKYVRAQKTYNNKAPLYRIPEMFETADEMYRRIDDTVHLFFKQARKAHRRALEAENPEMSQEDLNERTKSIVDNVNYYLNEGEDAASKGFAPNSKFTKLMILTLKTIKTRHGDKVDTNAIDVHIKALESGQLQPYLYRQLMSFGLRPTSKSAYLMFGVPEDQLPADLEQDSNYREGWQTTVGERSGKESVSQRLKMKLAFIPKTKDGQRMKNEIGMPVFYTMTEAYNTILARIGNATSVKDMKEKIAKIPISTIRKELLNLIANDQEGFTGDLYQVAQQNRATFLAVVGQGGSYKMVSSDRFTVKNSIIASFQAVDKPKKIGKEILKMNSEQLRKVLHDNGLMLPIEVVEAIVSAKGTTHNNDAQAALGAISEFSQTYDYADGVKVNELVKRIEPFYPKEFESAFYSVHGEKVHSWIRSSYMGRMINKIANGEITQQDYLNNLLLNDSAILKARGHKFVVMDGVKHYGRRDGNQYSDMSPKELMLSQVVGWMDGVYWSPVLSDSPAMAGIKMQSEFVADKGVLERLITKEVDHVERLTQYEKEIEAAIEKAKKDKKKFNVPQMYRVLKEMKSFNKKYKQQLMFPDATRDNISSYTTKLLNEQAKKLYSEYKKVGLIYENKDGEIVTSYNNTKGMNNIGEELKGFLIKDLVFKTEFTYLMLNHPSQYKNVEDFYKRAKQIWSPGTYLNTEALDQQTYNVEYLESEVKTVNTNQISGNIVSNFLKKYGFTIEQSQELLLDLGSKNIKLDTKNLDQVAKALAQPLAKLMNYSPEFNNIKKEFQKYENLEEEVNQVLENNPTYNKAKAVSIVFERMFIDVLESGFKRNFALKKNLLDKIKQFVAELIEAFKGVDIIKVNSIVDDIVNKTIKGEDFISVEKKEGYTKLDFQDAFNRDKKAQKIMTMLGTDSRLALTGSIAYAPQGTIYRKEGTPIHDVDFKVIDKSMDVKAFVKSRFPNAAQVNDFKSGNNHVRTYSIPASDLGIDFKEPSGKLSKEEFKKAISDAQILVDFFVDNVKTEFVQEDFIGTDGKTYKVNLVSYGQGFDAKLNISRPKDIWDYVLFIPNQTKSENYDAIAKMLKDSPRKDEIMAFYEEVDVTDAQSYIDPFSYLQRMKGLSRDDFATQKAIELLMQGKSEFELDNSKESQEIKKAIQKIQPLKPFYYGKHPVQTSSSDYDTDFEYEVAVQNKDSEYVILPIHADIRQKFYNPKFKGYLERMGYKFMYQDKITKEDVSYTYAKNNPDKVDFVVQFDRIGRLKGLYTDKFTYDSALKVGLYGVGDGTRHQFSYDNWRLQVETPEHYVDSKVLLGSQIAKLITGDLDKSDQHLIDRFHELMKQDIDYDKSEFRKRFYNENGEFSFEAFIEMLRQEVIEQKLGEQYLDALEIVNGETKLPLWFPLHAKRIEAMIYSLYRNNITKRYFKKNGVTYINLTADGFNEKLKIKKNDKGQVIYEVMAPPHNKIFWQKRFLTNGYPDADKVRKVYPELLEGIVYRIPTEDKYSMFNVEIKQFLPIASGAIAMPEEVTSIAGLDFDIDKVFGFFKSIDDPELQSSKEIREIKAEYQPRLNKLYEEKTTVWLDQQEYFENLEVDNLNAQKASETYQTIEKEIEVVLEANREIKDQLDQVLEDIEDYDTDSLNDAFDELEKIIDDNNAYLQELRDKQEEIKEYHKDIKLQKPSREKIREFINSIKAKRSELDFKITLTKSEMNEKLRPLQEKIANKIKSDNEKIEIMQEILGKYIEQKFKAGSFDRLSENNRKIRFLQQKPKKDKSTEYTWDEFSKLPVNTQEDILSKGSKLSFNQAFHQILVQIRMNMGKALIGIAANNNVAHSMIQSKGVYLKDSLNIGNAPYDNLSGLYDKMGKRITENISETLAAFVDNGKDPQAEYFNMNQYTADVAYLFLHLGMPLEHMQLFIAQPVLRELANEYSNNGGNAYKALQTIVEKHKVSSSKEDFSKLTPEKLEQNIANNTMDSAVLSLFIKLKDNEAKRLSELVTVLKDGDVGLGPDQFTVYDVLKRHREYTSVELENDPLQNSQDLLTNDHYMNYLWREGMQKPSKEIIKNLEFPDIMKGHFASVFSKIETDTSPGQSLSKKDTETIYFEYLRYLASKSDLYKYRRLELLPAKVEKLKLKYPNNKFLTRLRTKEVSIGNKEVYPVVEFTGTIGADKGEIDRIRNSFMDLLINEPEIAQDLARYAFYKDGFSMSMGGFAAYVPIELFLDTESGKNFLDQFKKLVLGSTINTFDTSNFAKQVVQNNFDKLGYVRFMTTEEFESNNFAYDPETDPKYKKYIKRDKKKGDIVKLFQGIGNRYVEVQPLGLWDGANHIFSKYTPAQDEGEKETTLPEVGENVSTDNNVDYTEQNDIRPEFDQQLANQLQAKLETLYPEIKLTITETPVWEKGDNIFDQQRDFEERVSFRLKIVDALIGLAEPKETKRTKKYGEVTKPERLTIRLNTKSRPNLETNIRKTLRGKGVPDVQIDFMFDYMKSRNIKAISTEQLALDIMTSYSFPVEIEVGKKGYTAGYLDPTDVDNYGINPNVPSIDISSPSEAKRIQPEDLANVDGETRDINVVVGGSIVAYEVIDDGTYYYIDTDYYGVLKISKEKIENPQIKPSEYYQSLTVPGGTEYRENRILTPSIIPSIRGHAQFAEENDIGWFRSDNASVLDTKKQESPFKIGNKKVGTSEARKLLPTKTRRILEVQSDLFQKGRDKKDLIKNSSKGYYAGSEVIYNNSDAIIYNMPEDNDDYTLQLSNGKIIYDVKEEEFLPKQQLSIQKENQFLQLLNKNNNWVRFFIQSIVQDSAKKGFEKVVFPAGDTAMKIEGLQTLENYKKQKEFRIKELTRKKNQSVDYIDSNDDFFVVEKGEEFWQFNGDLEKRFKTKQEALDYKKEKSKDFDREINQLKAEIRRVEKEGFGALQPIYKFYEERVGNTLKKMYDVTRVKDEHGNEWNEIVIDQTRDLSNIMLQRDDANRIIGQANIEAATVLIDAINQKQDTLPHEYAHHYIAWYRDSDIVQEAIAKWGSEEALVQAIGEQVVKQKGEAYSWWTKFVDWIMTNIGGLSELEKDQLSKILTDAFLTRQDLTQYNTDPNSKTAIAELESQQGNKKFSELGNMTVKDYVAMQRNLGLKDNIIYSTLKTCKGL